MRIRVSRSKNRLLPPEDLRKSDRYEQVMELDFREMIPFVFSHIRRHSMISLIYFVLNLLTLLFAIAYAVWGLKNGHMQGASVFRQAAAGILVGSILVIPVHELVHGLAYRILGAKRIRFGADMTQMIFYVTADRYPLRGRQLIFLAMAPFVIINMASLLALLFWLPGSVLLVTLFLLSHNVMCIGDFAITNYIHLSPGKIISWDEVDSMKSYFFRDTEPVC